MIMKKILLLAVVMFASLNASAQFYAGGSIGFGSVKPVGGGDSEFVFKILPEVGYQINDQWAAGAVLGYSKGLPLCMAKTWNRDFSDHTQRRRYSRFLLMHDTRLPTGILLNCFLMVKYPLQALRMAAVTLHWE